jgi:hypothetical protein
MTRPANDFWSRRRAAVRAEDNAETAIEQERLATEERAALEARDDADILAELDLPDPDTLKLGDDIKGFMSQAVPERLRRRALRQLWTLNPVLANVDGLVDYGGDFTDAATVIENMQTAYQVGKGMLGQFEKLLEEDAEPPQDAPAEADPLLSAQAAEAAEDDQPEALAPGIGEPDPQAEAIDPPAAVYAARPARRMRFQFEGHS